MLPGPLRPPVRFDPHRRRRVRRAWSRTGPVAVPLVVLVLLLGLLLSRAGAATADPGGPPAAPVDPAAGLELPGLALGAGSAPAGPSDVRGWAADAVPTGPTTGTTAASAAPAPRDLAGPRSVVVAVAPLEPGLLPLLRPGDRVDVYGSAPPDATGAAGPRADEPVGPSPPGGAAVTGQWPPLVPVHVTRLVGGALVVAVPGPADGSAATAAVPAGTVALAVSDADARLLSGARPGGLDLALRPRGRGP